MLILLDIDGVMVPANSWRKPELLEDGFAAFNIKSVNALQKIIYATDASILLTTSHKSKYSIGQWINIFKLRNIFVKNISTLANNNTNLSRKEEILNWYQSEHCSIENFVIIDDDKSLNALPNNIKANLVLTSSSVGLTNELADDAISILKRKTLTFV